MGSERTGRCAVATHAELKQKGVVVVAGAQRRIAVFADGDAVYAVENNCPHMGFPLDRGSVRDGMLTCHWHQARFDLRSGCTFDLWADDVPRYESWIEDGVVYVDSEPSVAFDAAHHRARLQRGMEQNIGLVQAKSILALLSDDESVARIVRSAIDFASTNLTEVTEGLIRLACVARLYPNLSKETAYQGLYYAVRAIANEASNSPPRRAREPLLEHHDLATLKSWMRQWVQTRHRDGAERTALTGLRELSARDNAELIFSRRHRTAVCQRRSRTRELQQGVRTDRNARRRRRTEAGAVVDARPDGSARARREHELAPPGGTGGAVARTRSAPARGARPPRRSAVAPRRLAHGD